MRATEILRKFLDMIDSIDSREQQGIEAEVTVNQNSEEDNRFKQILAMIDSDSFGQFANSPNEIVAPVTSVTTDAGGGVNGPKHPADIRIKDPRGFR